MRALIFFIFLSISLCALVPHHRNRKHRSNDCFDSISFGNPAFQATVSSNSSLISPDPLDGSWNSWSMTFTFVFNTSSVISPKLVYAVLSSTSYGNAWPLLRNITSWTSLSGQSIRSVVSGRSPTTPGLYHLSWLVYYGSNGLTLGTLSTSIEVTCSAPVVNFCTEGERRWIVSTGRCVRTYLPCGQETAVGVPETDNCRIYPCDSVTKTCGKTPLGGAQCERCKCFPQCDSGVICGDNDGCGGSCGTCPSGTMCNNDGTACNPCTLVDCAAAGRLCGDNGCGGSCGTCSDPTTPYCGPAYTCVTDLPGTCKTPYPLFLNSLAVGDAALNPGDKTGIQVWVLNNNSTTSVEPISAPVSASNRASLGLPADQVTVPKTGVRLRIFYDSSKGYVDSIEPIFNGANIPDLIFHFTIPNTTVAQGMEAYLLGQDTDRDMFLAVMKWNGSACIQLDSSTPPVTPADAFYSDDASPPGGVGSHVYMSALTPGDYVLVATHYSSSNVGTSWLDVIFTDATNGPCFPKCSGKFCGENGCGGICNVRTCDSGYSCRNGKCTVCPLPIPQGFTPNCQSPGSELYPAPYNNESSSYSRNCGQDNDLCLESSTSCGSCPTGSACQLKMGICVAIPTCDSFVPVCLDPVPTGPGQYFCSSRCKWTELNEPLPEIIPNTEDEVLSTTQLQWKNFEAASCTLGEKCISKPGWQLLLRFNTNIHNVGTATYYAESPYARPDELVYSTCHQHYHHAGFANYILTDPSTSRVVFSGGKLSYCVVTNGSFQTGPKVTCPETSRTTCTSQGLEPGNTDSYTSDLDCQWMELTALHEQSALNAWYIYKVQINQIRSISEYTNLNNDIVFPIFIPCAPQKDDVIDLPQYLKDHPEVCCSRPGGPVPGVCDAPVNGCNGVTTPVRGNCQQVLF